MGSNLLVAMAVATMIGGPIIWLRAVWRDVGHNLPWRMPK